MKMIDFDAEVDAVEDVIEDLLIEWAKKNYPDRPNLISKTDVHEKIADLAFSIVDSL